MSAPPVYDWCDGTLRGQSFNFSVGTTSQLLLSSNNYRRTLLASSPSGPVGGGGSAPVVNLIATQIVFSSSPQALCDFIVPVGTAANLTNCWGRTVSGNVPNMQPQWTRGGILFNISTPITQNVIQPMNLWFMPGDEIFMNVNGTLNGTIQVWMDWVLYGAGTGTNVSNNQVWLSFGAPAVLNQGIPVYGGVSPFHITYDDYGAMLSLDLYAIALAPATPLNILVGYEG